MPFLGAVVQHPLTGLGNTRSHLVKVKVPRSRYWRLAAADPVDVLGVALCATPGCAAPNGAGRLCPRDAGLCYAEVPADNSCAQTVQRELQASAAGEVAAALFHSVQPVAPPADAYACAANHYVADGACAPCPANTFSPGGSAAACSPVQCAANEYHELDEWIVGEPGATCDATCGAVSKQCDAVMQSSIRSAEELQALVFDLIAVDCAAGGAYSSSAAPARRPNSTRSSAGGARAARAVGAIQRSVSGARRVAGTAASPKAQTGVASCESAWAKPSPRSVTTAPPRSGTTATESARTVGAG